MSEAKHTPTWRAQVNRLYADDTYIANCRSEISAAYILHRLTSHAQMLEALRVAFPILVRLAEQQRQERGGSGLMEGPSCNTAEYLAYCSVRAAIAAAEAGSAS